jgi:hypothetical protein
VSYLVWASEVRDRAIAKSRIILVDIFFAVGFWVFLDFFIEGRQFGISG